MQEPITRFCRLFKNEYLPPIENPYNLNLSLACKLEDIPEFASINQLFKLFSLRDSCTIIIKNDYDDPIQLNGCASQSEGFNEKLEQYDPDDEIIVKLEIDKNILNSVLSIYCFDSFMRYIETSTTLGLLNEFSDLLRNREYIIFELFDSNVSFCTKSMFTKKIDEELEIPKTQRLECLDNRKDNTLFHNHTNYSLLPEDFHFKSVPQNEILSSAFCNLSCILSLIYISSRSTIESFHDNPELSLQISGQHELCCSYDLNAQVFNNPVIYRVYCWIYSSRNHSIDKAAIARNVISLHSKNEDLLQLDPKILMTIDSNYALYLQENVSTHINLKKDLTDYVVKSVETINDAISTVSKRTKNNLVALFSFIFTVFLGKTVGKGWDEIFNKELTFIFVIILIGSIVYFFLFVNSEFNDNLKRLEEGYDSMKELYRDLLCAEELDSIFNKENTLLPKIKKAKKRRNYFMIIWLIIIVFLYVAVNYISSFSFPEILQEIITILFNKTP